jgi:predicted N-acetyltransferase YhbS
VSDGLQIEKLRAGHRIADFDCGREALNRYLIRYAWQNQQAGAAQSWVALDGDVVIGYYTLVVSEVAFEDAAERLRKGLARHPVPVMLLARLAVSHGRQGSKLGGGLLKDALLRTLQAADIAGIRALVVHAKDDHARAFYERFDFAPSPTDPFHLFVLLKDVRALFQS